jgi:hypothetical protein
MTDDESSAGRVEIGYEYGVRAIPFSEFSHVGVATMNEMGQHGWHVFHLHEVLLNGEPTMMIYMSRKLWA